MGGMDEHQIQSGARFRQQRCFAKTFSGGVAEMKSISFRNSKSGRLKLPILFGALVWVIALAGLTSGCVFIPTPHYYAVGSRQNVTEQSTNLIQTGADTIEDVMLKLGEPEAVSPDERRIAYGSKKFVGQLFVVGVDTDGSDLPDVTQYRFLN